MLILESEQGKDKSTALQKLALDPDWFTDDLPLHVDGKRVIEVLQGRWIIEAGELSGMRKADTEQLKVFLARQVDRARMAYGRLPMEWPRQCVIFGTTNSKSYLKDLTGNRRYWPVAVGQFDVAALERDVEQLWAEAAVREAMGDGIRLNPKLYQAASKEQEQRTVDDAFYEKLAHQIGHIKRGKITKERVWLLLDIPQTADRSLAMSERLSAAMTRLGWKVPDNRTISHNSQKVAGFTIGEPEWPAVTDEDIAT
jgi:predicted P-loop ATPase